MERGFTLIELMVVIAVVAILAMVALPGIQGKLVSDQVVEAMRLADIAKAPIAAAWARSHSLPAGNAEAGLPPPERVVSNLVGALAVEAGAIHVTFGNRARAVLVGKTLSLRPAVIADAPVVPIAWVCGYAPVPRPMTVEGANRTDLPTALLPLNCRP